MRAVSEKEKKQTATGLTVSGVQKLPLNSLEDHVLNM